VTRYAITLLSCLAVVVACADYPHEASPLAGSCYAAKADSSVQIPTSSAERIPPSNIFKLHYFYPEYFARQHLQGRVLVRLRVAATGKVESAEFLSVEAPTPVQAEMCNLLQKLQYDVSKPGFETVDSRIFVLGIRYCVGNCNRVPVYPGFEKNEIAITGSELP
jgi:hypothetical protein